MTADDVYRLESMGIKCPQCGARLHITLVSDVMQLWCRAALGEIAWDDVRRVRYLPAEAVHSQYEYRLTDQRIAGQITRYEAEQKQLEAA